MKRLLTLAWGLLLATQAIAAPIPPTKVVKVNDRIYALLGPMDLPNKENQGYMVNSTLIIGDSGAIVIDTGFTDEIGAHLRKEVAKLTRKPVKVVINTHHHGDHTFGNVAFPEARVISSEMCRKLLLEGEAEWLALVEGAVGRKFPNTRAVPATEVYARNSRTDIVIDGVKLTLWIPDAAHTLGDLMIWLPQDKVLIGGDILVNRITPNFRDALVKKWVETLAEVQTLPARTIIPGHGPLMTLKDAAAMHDRMAKLYAGVEAGYKAGLTDSEIRAKLDLKEWKALKEFDVQMGGNINKTYLEVEASAF
ncbi:MAG: MBL fold metallo-hydrolase [Thiobacillus sp.]|nr:MBL fold metallo-hydrolase [Thiobacillus sp.]